VEGIVLAFLRQGPASTLTARGGPSGGGGTDGDRSAVPLPDRFMPATPEATDGPSRPPIDTF